MAPKAQDSWSDSDSDSDADADVETHVLLGLPDGPVPRASADLRDVAVSRLGGAPAFLNAPPPPAVGCATCAAPMPLLVQLWCPLEGSAFDRALYVFGCAQPGCQRKEGSVKAFRSLRHNAKYAAKLEYKRAQEAERRRKVEEEAAKRAAKKKNPFAMGSGAAPGMFGGEGMFGAKPEPQESEEDEDEDGEDSEDEDEDEGEEDGSDSDESLVTAMAGASLDEASAAGWKDVPAYDPAIYLNTSAEYIPREKPKVPKGVKIEDPLEDEGGKGEWTGEGYENSMEVDRVFERFVERVGAEGAQCVRYDLGGIPLPFAADRVFDVLWPAPLTKPGTPVAVTRGAFGPPPPKRAFEAASVRGCARCGGWRVFECQLMPNLINVLREQTGENGAKRTMTVTDEERRREVQRGGGAGMEWGTCMVFSCAGDCCEGKELWAEEVVLVQWDE